MLLALALTLLTALVVGTIIVPVMRGTRSAPERAAFDRAVYRDQLKELEREAARGLISQDQAATARLEIERRLLALGTAPSAAPQGSAGNPRLAILLALILPGAALGIYLALGSPGLPDQPFAARQAERSVTAADGQLDLDKTVAALQEKLRANPESAEGWLLLARTQAARHRWQESADAYRRAMELAKGRPDIAASYGEMLVMAADGIVTPAAHEAFSAVATQDPGNAAARFYLALAAAQAGDAQTAIAGWQSLAAETPADSPLRSELQRRIGDAATRAGLAVPELAAPAPGPTERDVAAAGDKTPAQRQEMIRGMVEGLAAKLAAHPEDVAGWQRLGRAYSVLGEREKAADAYEHAAQLKPEDISMLLAEAEALLGGLKPEDPFPERALTVLKRIEARMPGQPAVLWYLGLAAAKARDFKGAEGYWQRFLAVTPPDSEEYKAVSAALATVQGK